VTEVKGKPHLPIVQYWHSDDVPAEIGELVASFRELNPERRHLLFSETSAAEFIAEHFSSRELDAFRRCAVPSMQADYFRYCAVLALGGIYSDVGFCCRKSLQGLIDANDGGQLFKRPRGHLLNGLFLFKYPDHPLLRLTLRLATANIERGSMEQVWAVTGPAIFTNLHFRCQQGLAIESLGAAGAHARLVEAFEDVDIRPIASVADSIGPPAAPLRYRQSETHWVKWQERGATIFR
jgi:mannosyltransferase OCH1-like enzyme